MKRYSAILVILILAVFAAGCAAEGGFQDQPLIDDQWTEVDFDEPVDYETDDDTDGSGGDVEYRPVGARDDLVVNIPKAEPVGDLRRAKDVVLMLPESDDPDVDAPWIDVDWNGIPVKCESFETVSAGDECVEISCENDDDPDGCLEAENHSITCGDVEDWLDGLQKSCEQYDEEVCIGGELFDACMPKWKTNPYIAEEKRICQMERDEFKDVFANSGCYPNIGVTQEFLRNTAGLAQDFQNRATIQ